MKSIKRLIGKIIAAAILTLTFAPTVFAQTPLQFTGIVATQEKAIQLTWASVSNETYEIDEADTLVTNSSGTITWNQLYTEYPSQGTNTFWLDTGNYSDVPPILHPKYSPARYYRILDLGPDTTSDEPLVALTSPTNGAIVSGDLTITVNASTDQAGDLSMLLFVDGQQMDADITVSNSADGITNSVVATYVINTCEWFNGQHTLFATARCGSAPEGGEPNTTAPLVGHAVSAFVPVVFNNLVTEIGFSQFFFDPTQGQTQDVTCVFAEDSDWTLTITDANTNEVRTVTGSGTTMNFNWNGTGDGGTALPAGIYWYFVSAQTNGQTPSASSGDGGGGTTGSSGPPSPDFVPSFSQSQAQATQTWVQPSDGSGVPVPWIIMPPGFDTNGFDIFEEPISWDPFLTAPSASVISSTPHADYASPMGMGASAPSPPGGQSAPGAPVRPPTAPVRGTVGTIGVAYQTYTENGSRGYTLGDPMNCVIGGVIKIQNFPTDAYLNFDPLPSHGPQANNFITAMKKGGWSLGFKTADNQVTANTVTGSGSPFNQVNLGLLLLHGVYGGAEDYCTTHACKQMYFPIGNYYGSASWVSMSQMNFGGTATNGLEWMAIDACFSLYHPNWNSMQSQGVLPYNSNLHLLLGIESVSYTVPHIESLWAQYMLFGKNGGPPMTIAAAWYQGARDAYVLDGLKGADTVTFAVAGDANCSGDYLKTNSPPTGTAYYDSSQVYP